MFKRIFAVSVAMLIGLGYSASWAGTESDRSEAVARQVYAAPDAEAAFAALSKRDRQLFAARMSAWIAVEDTERSGPVVSSGDSVTAAAAGGCWNQYKYYKWYDLGVNTGDTWMQANWCSNGSSITSYSLTNRGGQGYKGIKYEGLGQKYTRNLGWEVRQAQTFKFSILWANANPCMQLRGGATGLYSFRANCNLG